MSILDFVMLAFPVVFLVLSVVIAVKAFERGKSPKTTVLMQIASFCAVFAICFAVPMLANAAGETTASGDMGMGLIGAGIATGLSCIGGGIAVGGAAPAAIGATSEDPKNFGKSIIFVALGEGCALYGMLISIMILSKLG